MKCPVKFFALASVALATEWPKQKPLQKYTIDLDLAPEQRFVEVVKDHERYVKALVSILKGLFSGDAAKEFLAKAVVAEENRREMQGIADALGLDYQDALLAHYFYEVSGLPGVSETLPEEWRQVATRSCTGIVAQDSNGTVMMARNQDYPPPLSPLQFDGTFIKGGKVLYEATSFAGNVGIGGTCMVPGKFSAEINAREANTPSQAEILASVAAGKPCFPMLLRQACERASDFEDAVEFFSDADMILGGYVTVAGAAPGEGAIVTRNATGGNETDVLRLADGYPRDSDDPWFLVQTNYDHWEKAPTADDRRDQGICLMGNLGQDAVDLDELWKVMSVQGSLGKDGKCRAVRGVYNVATIHTELVIPVAGEYHTYLRHNIIEDVVV